MKLNISKENLLPALQKVNSIISSRSTLQILSNVLLEAEDNKLKLTTTDLDIRIKTEVEAEIDTEGKTTLPARKFLEIVKEFSGENINISVSENHIELACGNSDFKILGLPADDFPVSTQTESLRELNIEQAELYRMINLISYAVTTDESRKALGGILLNLSENNFVTVATDGRRLALVEKAMEEFKGNEGQTILPSKTAQELCRVLKKSGNVLIKIGENNISFELDDNTTISSKLIEENYPNYKQVIPVSFSRRIEIPRESFAAVLRRASLVVSENNYYIKMKFSKNKLEVNALSSEVGESTDFISIEYDGPEIELSFNPTFLLDPIVRLDCDTVILKMNDGVSPIGITNEDGFLYIIMPMINRK